MAKRKQMTDEQLATIIKAEIEGASGSDSDELVVNRQKALEYYYGQPRGDEIPGRSHVQSLDVADMVEATVAQIMPAFEIENPVMFEAEGAADVEAALLESEAVNYMIMERNRGHIFFQESIRDALLLRNGWGKVWVETKVDTETHTFDSIDPIAAFEIISTPETPQQKIEVTSQEENEDGTLNVSIKVTITTRELKVASADPTMMLYSENHNSIFLDDIRFIAELDYPTRSDLIESGFDKKKVMAIPVATVSAGTDQTARNRGESWGEFTAVTPDQEQVKAYECYMLIDWDGDGISERRKILMAGSTILENEPVEFVPYATGTPFLQPHRVTGLSLFDKLRQIQDTKTATLRNYIDNMAANNNSRTAYRKGSVNTDHLLNSRPGGAVECMDPQTDLVPLPVTDTGNSNLQLLDYQDRMRSERGGASLDLQGAAAQIKGDTAQGIERQYSSREQLAAMMCKTLAETLVRSLYMKTHEAMRLLMPGEIEFQRAGEFVQTDPAQWRKRDRLNIKSGLSQGERQRKIAALSSIIAEQKELAALGQGGIMFNAAGAHSAYTDQARAAGLNTPERYWQDPNSQEAQQASQQKQQQAQQEAAAQKASQDQILAVQKQIADQGNAVDMYKARMDTIVDTMKIAAGLEETEAKIVGEAAVQLEKTALTLVEEKVEKVAGLDD